MFSSTWKLSIFFIVVIRLVLQRLQQRRLYVPNHIQCTHRPSRLYWFQLRRRRRRIKENQNAVTKMLILTRTTPRHRNQKLLFNEAGFLVKSNVCYSWVKSVLVISQFKFKTQISSVDYHTCVHLSHLKCCTNLLSIPFVLNQNVKGKCKCHSIINHLSVSKTKWDLCIPIFVDMFHNHDT
jgi:hypothetical protein